jgi:hypothetical protein
VLSDHGQTQGATFEQRNGYALEDLVHYRASRQSLFTPRSVSARFVGERPCALLQGVLLPELATVARIRILSCASTALGCNTKSRRSDTDRASSIERCWLGYRSAPPAGARFQRAFVLLTLLG